jgi:hypothetical protein
MQEQWVPSNTPPAYMGRRASVLIARYRSRPFHRYWAVTQPLCRLVVVSRARFRDLTSNPPSQCPNQCSTRSSLHHRYLSYHRLDPQGPLTCRKPARPKDGCFLGCQHSAACCTYLPHHASESYSNLNRTDKMPQLRLHIPNKRPLPHAKASETSNSASDSIWMPS